MDGLGEGCKRTMTAVKSCVHLTPLTIFLCNVSMLLCTPSKEKALDNRVAMICHRQACCMNPELESAVVRMRMTNLAGLVRIIFCSWLAALTTARRLCIFTSSYRGSCRRHRPTRCSPITDTHQLMLPTLLVEPGNRPVPTLQLSQKDQSVTLDKAQDWSQASFSIQHNCTSYNAV